jgi:hypothetical protein
MYIPANAGIIENFLMVNGWGVMSEKMYTFAP